jgi:hypothetical protein
MPRFHHKTGRHSPPRGIKLPRVPKNPHHLTTRSGRNVRSKLEQLCADYFTECGIEFKYEPLMLIGGRQCRPDFYLPEYGAFVEICGCTHMPFYRDRVAEKRELYARHGMKAIFIIHKRGDNLLAQLRAELKELVSGKNQRNT